jgi:predicted TPR repeat methyltransferase
MAHPGLRTAAADDNRLPAAQAAHQAGRLDEAEAGYRGILAAWPDHADALHLLGVIRHQRGDAAGAVASIGRAIAIRNDNYKYHYNLAIALQVQGRLDEAVTGYRAAVALAPAVTAVRVALAEALQRLGRLDEATAAYRDALAQAPEDATLHFALGTLLQARGELEEAEESYRCALDHRPDHAPTLVNLGTVLHARGRLDQAATCHRRAVAAEPGFAPAHLNLGAALQAQGRLFDAVKSYRRVLTLTPNEATAHFNLGTAVQAVGWLEEAMRCYQDACRLAPDYAEAHNNLGQCLEARGRLAEAVAAHRRACALRPDQVAFHNNLACALYLLHRQDPAAARAEGAAWAATHPDQPIARHMARALTGGGPPPPQPPPSYVRTLFDGFAASFERELLGIGYCGPHLMAEAFTRVLPTPRGDRAVLDAGCGTGLCAPVLRPWARTLTGVDVSPRMLELARHRNLYDGLVVAELTEYLPACPQAFDFIAAADVLCYFGDLGPVIAGLSGALRRQGALAFTVEQAPDAAEPFRLAAHGRYLHGETALRALLARHELAVAALSVANLRDEDGQPSPNLVVLAVRG